ncbi:MAG: type II toxin-antitoxin system HigB family toxin [Chitinophagales bacterium]|nr:type II toxin-antitoxin system HigB family toxin [Chitinophagales bacterium]
MAGIVFYDCWTIQLIVYIRYNIKIIYIRFIGTHAEYDRINAKEV